MRNELFHTHTHTYLYMSQATLKVAGDTMTYNTVINCLRQRPRAGPPPGSFQRPCRPLQLGAGVLVSDNLGGNLLVRSLEAHLGDCYDMARGVVEDAISAGRKIDDLEQRHPRLL